MERPRKKAEKARTDYVQSDLPGMPFFRDTPAGASGMLLRTSADVFARWYSALNGAAEREKARQRDYRKEHGYKASAKVDHMPLSPSDSEESVATASESVIRAMFGDQVADYARDKFLNAMSTGDKRAFKIRLLMLKARDSLKGLMHEEFSKYVDIYIADAENVAGCRESPKGPRRMSKSEKERKQRKEAYEKACSVDLFSYVQDGERQDARNQDIDTPSEAVMSTKAVSQRNVNKRESFKHNSINGNEQKINKVIETTEERYGNGYCNANCNADSTTVSHGDRKSERPGPYSRDRRYESTSEILDDVKSGRMTMYGSPSEIVADMKTGVLSPSEAMMFLSAYGQMLDKSGAGRGGRKRKVRDVDATPEDDELEREEKDFPDGYEEEEVEREAESEDAQGEGWEMPDGW